MIPQAAGNQGGSPSLSQLEILVQKMNQMEMQAPARDAEILALRQELQAVTKGKKARHMLKHWELTLRQKHMT